MSKLKIKINFEIGFETPELNDIQVEEYIQNKNDLDKIIVINEEEVKEKILKVLGCNWYDKGSTIKINKVKHELLEEQ